MATLAAVVAFIATAKDRKGSSVQAIRKALFGTKPRKYRKKRLPCCQNRELTVLSALPFPAQTSSRRR